MLFANTTHSPSRRNRSSDLTPRSRELAKDMREKFGFPSAGEMRRGNGRSHHEDAENANATKETKSVSSPMLSNNTRDLPKSPLRDSTNSPLRSASKEIRVSMSANVNQWRSERAEKNVTSSSTTTNTPTRLREVKLASTQTKEVTKEKKADVDVFGTRSMMAASRAKSSNATATAVVKEKDTTTTTREEKLLDDLVKKEREFERVTEALNNMKDAELELSRNNSKESVEFAQALERQIEEKVSKQLKEKEEELVHLKVTNQKGFETFTERIQQLESLVKEKDIKIKSLEMNAQEWQALAKRDASRAQLETLDMEKKLKEFERKNEELNVVVSTLLGKATKGVALEKDLEAIRLKQTTAKSVGTNTKAIPVAQPIQLQFTPETMKTPKEMVNASAQVNIKAPQAPPSVGTPLSAMKRKYQVHQNAIFAFQKEIEEREKQQQQQQQQETLTPKEPSPTIGFEWSAAYDAREMATQTSIDEEVKAEVEKDEPTSSECFDDDKQHWVPTPNTRKHVEEKYVGLQRQHPKEQSSSFSNTIDPTTSRFAMLTPIRVPQTRQPVVQHRAPERQSTTHYSRSAEESRRMYDDERMARLSRAMNLSDSPFRRRHL
ncbi:unnamed protein product [Bathycoccus prasinos]